MQKQNIHNVIVRLLSGEATFEEKETVKKWLEQSEDNKKLYSDLQEIWLTSGKNDYNTQEAIQRFRNTICKKRKKVVSIQRFLRYAAIFILLIALPFMYFVGKHESTSEQTFTTITCAIGDKSNVTLPDGSTVCLNSGSKLIFDNNFKGKYRQVFLEGEAYFSVKKNIEIPFKVKASEIEIEVLGTEFDLRAYADEDFISTTLVKGSVKINSQLQNITMKPSEKAIFNKTENKIKLYAISGIIHETEWKDGRLVFINESLGDLELKLERWFDVDIEFSDEQVKNRKFSGTLERESILEAVSYFGYSEHVGYKIEENKITFYSK